MASGTQQKKKQGTAETLLASQQKLAEKRVNSVLLVKKLLAIGLSEIAYCRMLYPLDNFTEVDLNGKSLRVMRSDKCKMGKLLQSSFDAIDKQYLKVLCLGIYMNQEDPSSVCESYTFTFRYEKEDVICAFYNENKCYCTSDTYAATKESASKLLANLQQVLGSMPELPESKAFKLKLGYRSITPDEYDPPGFVPCGQGPHLFNYAADTKQIDFGQVPTVVQSLKLTVRAIESCLPKKEDLPEGIELEDTVLSPKFLSAAPASIENKENQRVRQRGETSSSEDDPEVIIPAKRRRTPRGAKNISRIDELSDAVDENEKKEVAALNERSSGRRTSSSLEPIKEQSPAREKETEEDEDSGVDEEAEGAREDDYLEEEEEMEVLEEDVEDSDEVVVRCPCKGDMLEQLMICCSQCGKYAHMGCYGYPADTSVPRTFFCYYCARQQSDDSQQIQCNVDAQLNETDAQDLCLFRRGILVASEDNSVTAAKLSDRLLINSASANKLLKRLIAKDFVKKLPPKSKSKQHVVNLDQIEASMLEYFVTDDFSQTDREFQDEEETQIEEVDEVGENIIAKTQELSLDHNKDYSNTPSRRSKRKLTYPSAKNEGKSDQNLVVASYEFDDSTPIARTSISKTPIQEESRNKASKAKKQKNSKV